MEITNDTQNRKGPVLDPALCRCCRTIKKCRLLTKEYEWLGKKEVYSDMIMDCFGLLLSHLDGDDKDNCICATCVARLREASAFRKQVLYWEEALLQAKLDLQKDDDKQVVEVKLESSDDDGSRDAPCPDDGFQNVSDSEDATALSQLKIVKTESTLTKPKLKKVITRKVSKCIDKPKKDLLLKRKLLNEMKKTKSKLNKQKRLDEPDAENNKRRDAETIVHYTTAYPFRISHGKDFFIECVYCRTMFVEPEKFRSHMEEEHKSFEMDITFARIGLNGDFGKVDISELRCRVCKKDFKKMDAIALHLQSEHEVNLCTDITKGNLIPYKLERMAYRCGICDADFLYIREASKHIFTHFGRVTCELCGKTYAREFQLAAHMLFSHNPKKVCAVCKKGFETKEERRTHIRNTKSCYPFCCCECGERFTLKRLKEAHKEQVHGHVKRSPCGKCSKVFSDSRKLTEHFILSHSDRFACPYCDMKCPNKNRLEDHIVGHTKEAKFSCDVCSKSFPRKRALLTHKWNHVEKKRFECAYCDKKFNQKTSLKTHMRRYHPDVGI